MKSFFSLILTIALFSAPVSATSSLTGTWSVFWNGNDTPNTIILIETPTDITGHFFAKNGENCGIDGWRSHDDVYIAVTCVKWGAILKGKVSTNNDEVKGRFSTPNQAGEFTMKKNTH